MTTTNEREAIGGGQGRPAAWGPKPQSSPDTGLCRGCT